MATVTAPQWVQALDQAHATRAAQVAVRREVHAGTITFAEALGDERAGSLPVLRLLTAQRGVGLVKARKTLRWLQVSEHRRVRDLTERQVRLLADHRRRG